MISCPCIQSIISLHRGRLSVTLLEDNFEWHCVCFSVRRMQMEASSNSDKKGLKAEISYYCFRQRRTFCIFRVWPNSNCFICRFICLKQVVPSKWYATTENLLSDCACYDLPHSNKSPYCFCEPKTAEIRISYSNIFRFGFLWARGTYKALRSWKSVNWS